LRGDLTKPLQLHLVYVLLKLPPCKQVEALVLTGVGGGFSTASEVDELAEAVGTGMGTSSITAGRVVETEGAACKVVALAGAKALSGMMEGFRG
jgi:hypothetical protein